MDSTSSLEQQEAEIGQQIEQVSLSNNGSRPHARGSPGRSPPFRAPGDPAPSSGGTGPRAPLFPAGQIPRPFASSSSTSTEKPPSDGNNSVVDSGAAQLGEGGSVGGDGGEDMEMGLSSSAALPDTLPSSTNTDTATGANGQQPPAGAMPAGMPPGLPPGMPPMDPFAMLVQMSDRLIDESYQASSKDSETGLANKRPHSGAEGGGAGEPHIKVPKREEIAAEPSSSKQHRRYYENDFRRTPIKIAESWGEFNNQHKDNFLKGCKWSPDGTCILTCSNDNCLRVFNLPDELYCGKITSIPEMCAVLQMQEAELIYDYDWLPTMNSQDPATCSLVSTSRDTPVHMWDAFTGEIRCSYRAFDQVDELAPAYSVSFNPEGTKLYCGFNKNVRIFDVSRPGRDCVTRPTYNKSDHVGQTGIISCLAFNPTNTGLYAAGSYSRSVGVYSEPEGVATCVFEGQQGGVTHVLFSPDGNRLYSGGRKDPEILCWDLRYPGQILHTMTRQVATNQRIYFDIDNTGQYVLSGSHDGSVLVWDTREKPQQTDDNPEPFLNPILPYKAHEDTVNGISLHPSMPILATASGQRHVDVPGLMDVDSDVEEDDAEEEGDNSLRLWWIGK